MSMVNILAKHQAVNIVIHHTNNMMHFKDLLRKIQEY